MPDVAASSENLIHPPDKPAGVFFKEALLLARNLVHLPDEPAGVILQLLERTPGHESHRDKAGNSVG